MILIISKEYECGIFHVHKYLSFPSFCCVFVGRLCSHVELRQAFIKKVAVLLFVSLLRGQLPIYSDARSWQRFSFLRFFCCSWLNAMWINAAFNRVERVLYKFLSLVHFFWFQQVSACLCTHTLSFENAAFPCAFTIFLLVNTF
ncbi:hypothetical protein TRVL_00442 [Trypanosoma vivax]|nr:hypothetical protein TRVL_00442 [Trypanosoma vivax]